MPFLFLLVLVLSLCTVFVPVVMFLWNEDFSFAEKRCKINRGCFRTCRETAPWDFSGNAARLFRFSGNQDESYHPMPEEELLS